jgi:hypothetical protein
MVACLRVGRTGLPCPHSLTLRATGAAFSGGSTMPDALVLSLTPQEREHLAYLAELCGVSVEEYTSDLVRRHLPWVVMRVPAKEHGIVQTPYGYSVSSNIAIYED